MSDYHKMANSNVRNAIPEGYFGSGKSKQVYDVLYSLTRGAIKPTRTIQIPKPRLMKLAGVGSKVTIDNIVSRFCQNGLLSVVEEHSGNHNGNTYEVFTYDEIGSPPSPASPPSTASGTSHPQKLDILALPETAPTSRALEPVNTGVTDGPKTFFKDFLNDDDGAHVQKALETLVAASREVTGADIARSDWKAFQDLIDLFVSETAQAASRAGQVSSFIKFGIENLRRRLVVSNRQASDPVRPRDIAKASEPEPMSDENAKRFAAQYVEILKAEIKNVSTEELADWERLIASVKGSIPDHVFSAWFSRLTVAGIDREDRVLSISADEVTADWIRSNYEEVLSQAMAASGLEGHRVEWKAATETAGQFRARFSDEDWMKIDLFVEK